MVTLCKEAAIVQQNFLRDNAFNMKAGMLFIESSLAPCFIQMLQLIIKGSLILENSIIVLIAQARQIVDHLNHSSGAGFPDRKCSHLLGLQVCIPWGARRFLVFLGDFSLTWATVSLNFFH